MRVTTALAATAALAALAPAQVQTTVHALTPLTFAVTDGANSSTQTQPAGPLSPFGGAGATLPAPTGPAPSSGLLWWSVGPTSTYLQHYLNNPGPSPSVTASAGAHELLVEFTSTSPKAVLIRIERDLDLAAGATAPTISLDLDNDGTIDVADLSPASIETRAAVLGPQPTQVRIVVQASLGFATYVNDLTWVTLEPDNDLEIQQVVNGCAVQLPPPQPTVLPSFQNTGVDLVSQFQTGVVVLGLQPQPLLLSTFSYSGLPCLLVPQVDVSLAFSGAMNLPIPASVRPLTFYAQSAGLLLGELVVSDAYQVRAL